MKTNMKRLMYAAVGITMLFTACGDDNGAVAPITINFTNTEIGLSESVEVAITFSRSADADGTLTLQVATSSLVYGEDADFYTDPAMVDNEVNLSYEAGSESMSFTVFAGSALNIAQDETISLTLTDADGFVLGGDISATITVSENFIANEGTMEINGGGSDFPNQAYVDLSKLTQTVVDKYIWDLGFYTAAGEFSVILNSSATVMARPLESNNLTEVTAADTIEFGYEMAVPPPNFDSSIGSASWVDTPDGNLETTAFGTISETDSDNKVFIIKRDGEARNWKKVRVLRNGDGYTLQYADIDATTFSSIDIAKDESYHFITVDFENGIVNAMPPKYSWDFMYSTYTEILPLGPGSFIPYAYNDFIVLNRFETEISTVMTEDIAFENFASSDLESLEFETDIDAFGENWRQGGGPGSAPALYTDRYFIIKDSEGNSYKLQFTRLASESGERGYPEFKIELL